ncbi:MAG: UDP-N-acetylglucosamine 2-epimerase (non-hydrolyzing) [Bacteroidetes bacterium]|nr:UDP-N-acetylglucosamine 2-epimerase (non-hydrolyzing) [Bacteroidota bacterium]
MQKLKIMTVVGTRPEIIRLSTTIKLLDKYTNQVFVHTGQNYDYALNEIFFEDLSLRKPDHFMNVDTTSLGSAIGDIFKKTEEIIALEQPDALLVLGDTNSCLSAYMAKRKHIPVFHMEAGNRSFDFNVPEEVNRRIIDHIADFNLVYTEHARRHLLSEGLQHRRIYLTGSPMWEVLQQNKYKIDHSNIVDKLKLAPKKYFMVSVHREENVDNFENLSQILSIFNYVAEQYQLPVIVSTHPRTRKKIEALNQKSENNKLIQFLKPFGFTDYIHLQQNALCTISDSGTISEESAMLNFPAISLRESMERPEAQDTGSIILAGFEPDIVLNAVNTVIEEHKAHSNELTGKSKTLNAPQEYQIDNTSWRVLKLILGNTKLSNKWWGINC